MNIQLSGKYSLGYDGMGYTLYLRREKPRMNRGILEEFTVEGYYGTLDQVAHGLYRHGVHAPAIETVDELRKLQQDFVGTINPILTRTIATADDSDD
jgi:hypothetical protein